MPDLPPLAQESPDLTHEMLRQEMLSRIDDLTDHLQRITDSMLIGQTAFDFAETMLKAVVPLQQFVGTLAAVNPRAVSDGVTTAAGTTVTSASAQFAAYDQGRPIAGGSLPTGTTITTVTDAQTVTVSAAATADGTAVSLTIG